MRRRCSRRSRPRSARSACRSTCPPTAASASSTASSIRPATSDFSSVEAAHGALVDQVVEVDEELMSLYLEKGEVEPEQLHAPFEKALREGHLVPVCFVSARTGAGVAELLDDLRQAAAQSEGRQSAALHEGRGRRPRSSSTRSPILRKHVLAHVFKVVMDPFVGKLGIFRVHQGTVTRDTQLFVGDGRKPFKVGHLFMLQGGKNVEIDRAIPGDLAAVAKVDEIEFDCVLHDSHDEDQIHMQPLEFPTPMHGVAIEPKRRGDEGRISDVLHRMIAEDPTLKLEHDTNLNETVLWGLGDLHLRSVLERMSSQFKLEVTHASAAHSVSRDDHRVGGRPSPSQEADGRRGPVRRGVPEDRAAAARRGLRVRQHGQGRRDPDVAHPRRAERCRAGAHRRSDRGLSAAGRARERLRRQVPSRRLEGSRVRVGGTQGVPRRDREGAADRARAGRRYRDQLPRRTTWAT